MQLLQVHCGTELPYGNTFFFLLVQSAHMAMSIFSQFSVKLCLKRVGYIYEHHLFSYFKDAAKYPDVAEMCTIAPFEEHCSMCLAQEKNPMMSCGIKQHNIYFKIYP